MYHGRAVAWLNATGPGWQSRRSSTASRAPRLAARHRIPRLCSGSNPKHHSGKPPDRHTCDHSAANTSQKTSAGTPQAIGGRVLKMPCRRACRTCSIYSCCGYRSHAAVEGRFAIVTMFPSTFARDQLIVSSTEDLRSKWPVRKTRSESGPTASSFAL